MFKEIIILDGREYKLVEETIFSFGEEVAKINFHPKGVTGHTACYQRVNRGKEHKEVLVRMIITLDGGIRKF